jgi:hypothetical protein
MRVYTERWRWRWFRQLHCATSHLPQTTVTFRPCYCVSDVVLLRPCDLHLAIAIIESVVTIRGSSIQIAYGRPLSNASL